MYASIGSAVSPLHLLHRLSALEAHQPEANSLYEYATYQVFQAASVEGNAAHRNGLMSLVARPYSLEDLAGFTRQAGLARHFELASIPAGGIDRFLRTAEEKTTGRRSAVGLEGGAYLLGLDYVEAELRKALRNPHLEGVVRFAVDRAVDGPLPFLALNRLLHVLIGRDFLFKVLESARFPWRQSAPEDHQDGTDLSGTIHTGFLKSGTLAACLEEFHSVASAVTENSLRQRWIDWERACRDAVVRHPALGEDLIADLLKIHGTTTSRELAQALIGRQIQIFIVSREEMKALQERETENGKRREAAMRIETIRADYLLPEENEGWPAIVLSDEGLYGNVGLYREISQYNPLGFGLALRNFVEHLYIRQGDPLAL